MGLSTNSCDCFGYSDSLSHPVGGLNASSQLHMLIEPGFQGALDILLPHVVFIESVKGVDTVYSKLIHSRCSWLFPAYLPRCVYLSAKGADH